MAGDERLPNEVDNPYDGDDVDNEDDAYPDDALGEVYAYEPLANYLYVHHLTVISAGELGCRGLHAAKRSGFLIGDDAEDNAMRLGTTVQDIWGGEYETLPDWALTPVVRNVPLVVPAALPEFRPVVPERSSATPPREMPCLPARVVEIVANAYSLDTTTLLTDRRRQATDARGIVLYLCRTVCDLSFPAIAAIFGLHHTTVMSNVSRTIKRMNADLRLDSKVALLAARCARDDEPGAFEITEAERVPLKPGDTMVVRYTELAPTQSEMVRLGNWFAAAYPRCQLMILPPDATVSIIGPENVS